MRHDLDLAQGLEAICYCRYEETVCGTDNVTYDSQCQLTAAVSIKNQPIAVARSGPCNAGIAAAVAFLHFSRPYLSNGRAIVMVVMCLSVFL